MLRRVCQLGRQLGYQLLQERKGLPPRVADARRFLAQRGWKAHGRMRPKAIRSTRSPGATTTTGGLG